MTSPALKHHAKRIGLVPERRRTRREDPLARCTAPELDDLDPLVARSLLGDCGATAIVGSVPDASRCAGRAPPAGGFGGFRRYGCAGHREFGAGCVAWETGSGKWTGERGRGREFCTDWRREKVTDGGLCPARSATARRDGMSVGCRRCRTPQSHAFRWRHRRGGGWLCLDPCGLSGGSAVAWRPDRRLVYPSDGRIGANPGKPSLLVLADVGEIVGDL